MMNDGSPSVREKIWKSAGALLLGLMLGAALVSLPAFADWQSLTAKDFSIANPPTPNSSEDKEDFAKLHEFQKTRTTETCRIGGEQDHGHFKTFFKDREDLLSKKERQRAEPLMEKVEKVTKGIVGAFKDQHARPRPYNTDKSLKPCVARDARGSFAYPSGHATRGALETCLLASIYPDRKSALLEYGKFVGDVRVMIGVHHPSDVKAGQSLAQQICDRLLGDEHFAKELATVR